MAIMAAVHRIDIDKAFAIGMTRPQTPRDIALAYFGDTDRHYESHRTGPQPLIAFVRKWIFDHLPLHRTQTRSEEHTSELQSLMRSSYAVFCLKKKTATNNTTV